MTVSFVLLLGRLEFLGKLKMRNLSFPKINYRKPEESR